jgi:hypothetical protein
MPLQVQVATHRLLPLPLPLVVVRLLPEPAQARGQVLVRMPVPVGLPCASSCSRTLVRLFVAWCIGPW